MNEASAAPNRKHGVMTHTVPNRLNGVMLTVCTWIWLSGCGGGDTAPTAQSPAPPTPPAKAAPVEAKPPASSSPQAAQGAAPGVQTASADASQEPVYSYRAGNRRDPFRSIIVSGGRRVETSLSNPLQQYAVKDLRLIAIIWGQLGAGAMLETPDGKGYTVYVGTTVGNRDGVVKQIKPDQIVVKERYTDIFGERKEESVVLNLHLPEEGLK
jgi:hypothetical protein